MALETAGNREDVEQARRAGITTGYRAGAWRGPAEPSEVGSIRASRFHKAAGDSQ